MALPCFSWPDRLAMVPTRARMETMGNAAMQEATTTFEVLHELVAPAKRNLSKGHWDYLWGGSDTETTYERNRVAIDSIAFRPRVLRNVEKVDTGGKLLGHSLKLPIILAPIG